MTTEIELLGLSLNIKRDTKSARFPVMSASIQYRIGQLPLVQVTISSAALFSKGSGTSNSVDDTDISQLFIDSPDGTEATLVLDLRVNGGSAKTINLFSGYVSGLGSNLTTSIYTVQSNISFHLVNNLATINANPGGVFTAFSELGGSGEMLPKPYKLWLDTRVALFPPAASGSKDPKKAKLADYFSINPAWCLLKTIDHLRKTNAQISNISVSSCFDAKKIRFALKTNPAGNDIVAKLFAEKLAQALVGAPAASVAVSALRELLLTVVPQTLGTSGSTPGQKNTSLMIVRPGVSGWSPTSKIDLQAGDVLGIGDNTSYRLDQRVDFWYVVATTDPNRAGLPFPAVYAPRYGQKGKAVFLDQAAQQAAIEEVTKSNGALIGRMVALPWWMERIIQQTGPSGDGDKTTIKKNTTAESISSFLVRHGSLSTSVVNVDDTKKAWEDACKRLAVLSFLENGCAVNNVSLRLPFATLLKLLPWLGDTISFKTPSPMQTTKNQELYDIPGAQRFGLLDGLSMTFEMSHKEIHVTCSATLSQVHDLNIHKKMCAYNPIYQEKPDACYNEAAKKIIEDLF